MTHKNMNARGLMQELLEALKTIRDSDYKVMIDDHGIFLWNLDDWVECIDIHFPKPQFHEREDFIYRLMHGARE